MCESGVVRGDRGHRRTHSYLDDGTGGSNEVIDGNNASVDKHNHDGLAKSQHLAQSVCMHAPVYMHVSVCVCMCMCVCV
jgi:hypothetical protein